MGMNRRSLLQYSGLFGTAALATGLGLFKSSPSRAADIMPITMQLDWKYNVQFAGLLLADHLGLYKEKGLEVAIKPWESDMIVPDEVAAKPMMIGCSEQNLILEAQAKGVPLKAIATMFQASPYALMTMPDSGISSLNDLVGKQVGIHADGVKVMELVKGVNGIQPNDIEVIEIPYENKVERLISGELAAVQCYAVDEPIAFEQKVGQAPILLPMDQYGYKAYAQVFFTTDALLQQHPEQVKAFLAASFAGWQSALADVPGTAKLIAEKYAEPGSKYTDVDYQQKSLELVKEYILRGIPETQLGTISTEQWQKTTDLMAQYGIIDANPTVQASLDLTFWSGNG
ncbi:MAG TPA: ABC transporter substrate-binding protein [Trichocoleus sp.]|jgi:ABC-type nitrate/sulfonate/bicarbonate transport system substrate-binding protein